MVQETGCDTAVIEKRQKITMILEVVVTTVDTNDKVHIAPMGIRHSDDLVVIAPFKPSQTLMNLDATQSAVVNVTDDVRIYAGCLTGRSDWPTRPANRVNGRILKAALHCQELQVVNRVDDELRPQVFLSEVHQETIKPFPGFNRAQAAIIEASILVSRLHMLPKEKIDSEMAYLQISIEKTAGPREEEAWKWLIDAISEFRKQ